MYALLRHLTPRRNCTRRYLHLNFGAAGIPHPNKKQTGGEDGFFADRKSNSFGIADGVGGSASSTIDPGLFSRNLLQHCRTALQSPDTTLSNAMHIAALDVESQKLGGSSTVLLGRLVSGDRLELANIGDSGCIVLRPSLREFGPEKSVVLWPRAVLRTADQTHYFNCPFQVCSESFKEMLDSKQADFLECEVQEGDIIIAATDGVFDNIFDQQLQLIVAKYLTELRTDQADGLSSIAKAISSEAQRIGKLEDDPSVHTPFANAARSEGFKFPGGKLDDVAVIVALVCTRPLGSYSEAFDNLE